LLPATIEQSLGGENPSYLSPHVIVRDELACVQGELRNVFIAA
jgi:hypothetical protein